MRFTFIVLFLIPSTGNNSTSLQEKEREQKIPGLNRRENELLCFDTDQEPSASGSGIKYHPVHGIAVGKDGIYVTVKYNILPFIIGKLFEHSTFRNYPPGIKPIFKMYYKGILREEGGMNINSNTGKGDKLNEKRKIKTYAIGGIL